MAQNVGTPRFYVDIFSYLRAMGLTGDESSHFSCGLNPTNAGSYDFTHGGSEDLADFFSYKTSNLLSEEIIRNSTHNKTVYGFLGHNFNSVNIEPRVKINIENAADSYGQGIEIVNWGRDEVPEYDGFSLYEVEHGIEGGEFERWVFRIKSADDTTNAGTIKLGSIFIGTYYDMPHSPDLNLKLSYEYDGVKTIQTKGGATLSNATYAKPADWGEYGAWQLGNNKNYRNGRRKWDLSFSFLSDTDVMPNLGVQNYEADTEGDIVDTEDILTGTDFFSQVWNRTLGGHLPFIFQPDKDNNSPDQFAICRFDMNSLVYSQIAPNLYSLQCSIIESW